MTTPSPSQTKTASTPAAESASSSGKLIQSLGLYSSTAIVVGSMIGSGIFLVDSDIARVTNSPVLYLGAWVLTAAMTMIAALSYGELAAMMPRAGGQYVYIREPLGRSGAFSTAGQCSPSSRPAPSQRSAWAFGKFLGVFFPSVSTTNCSGTSRMCRQFLWGRWCLATWKSASARRTLRGIVVVFVLAFINLFGVRLGALVQNVFTSAKALSLAGLILLAFTVGINATAWNANFGAHWSQFLGECGLA